jgi:hypothetical protein
VCDALPHFGLGDSFIADKRFRILLITDAVLCVLLVGVLYSTSDPRWLIASICAFAATAPDLLWIRKYIFIRANQKFRANWIELFMKRIQWYERPIGTLIEVAWAGVAMYVLAILI